MDTEALKQLEVDLWAAADNLRANSDLKSSEYATPVLGLIFLKFADNKYSLAEEEILAEYSKLQGTRREKPIEDIAIEKCGLYLPSEARYQYLVDLPEGEDMPKKIKEALTAIERYKPELDGVLPKEEYRPLVRTDREIPSRLLKVFSNIPKDASGDILGKIYEFFLGKFALAEGQGGGEFFTPSSVVRLMVEIIEPYQGTVFDPACGSGGMFVQSQQFVERRKQELAELGQSTSSNQLFVYGQEKTLDTVKLAKMNIAVNGLRGSIQQANSYYEDEFNSFGKFDYVLANPPFNVDDVSLAKVEPDPRFNTYGVPKNKSKAKKGQEGKETVPNGNYLWINLFATSLSDKGRAALVMANSASDARHSEAEIRKTLIESNLIYGMLTLPSNMFYTVSLPATLWFFDKNKDDERVLFIDARNIFTQIDRRHREFNGEQIENIAVISKLYKGNRQAFTSLIDSYFSNGMELLKENSSHIEPIAEQLVEVLDDEVGAQTLRRLESQWDHLDDLENDLSGYKDAIGGILLSEYSADILAVNEQQHKLLKSFAPFFEEMHQELKQIGRIVREHEKRIAEDQKAQGKRATVDAKTKKLKGALEQLHKEVKSSESYFLHIKWLQDRFPKAEYEDVTGLCKLASQDEIKEQDYSLNPGRYVGVVIEEDGKTEEEFFEEFSKLSSSLEDLETESSCLSKDIMRNASFLLGGNS
jgi:type I restriction enzyme M protein